MAASGSFSWPLSPLATAAGTHLILRAITYVEFNLDEISYNTTGAHPSTPLDTAGLIKVSS